MNAWVDMLNTRHEAMPAQNVACAVSALSADQAFLSALGASTQWRGRVHSVFQHVINIEGPDGELFTLASRDIDDAPNTMVLDLVDFSCTAVAVDQQVAAAAGLIRIGNSFKVHLKTVKAWSSVLPVYEAASGRLRRNLDALEFHLRHEGCLDGMLRSTLVGNDDGVDCGISFEHAVSKMLANTSGQLRNALLRQDVYDACAQARLLIGLGPGLTPSGDDFLVGLFAALNVHQAPLYGLRAVCVEMVAGAERATNAISYAALSKASTGRVRACMAELIKQLIHGETGAFAAPLARVLAIGSTSGSDIVAGIVSGLRLQLEFERSDTPLQLRLPKAAITPPLRVPPTKPTISGQPPCGD